MKKRQTQSSATGHRARAIAGVLIISAAGVIAGLYAVHVRARSRLDVAFYGLSPAIVDALTTAIEDEYAESASATFTAIPDSAPLTPRSVKKYDLLFMWNGAVAENCAAHAQPFPRHLFHLVPAALRERSDASTLLPLLLDHCELDYHKEAESAHGIAPPETLATFLTSLYDAAAVYDHPLLIAGNDDAHLLDFISVLVEAIVGADGYRTLVQAVKATPKFETVSVVPLTTDAAGTPVTLMTVLSLLELFQEQNILYPQWYDVSLADVETFLREHALYAAVMPLSYHRTLPLRTIYTYQTVRFPVSTPEVRHAVIAPELVMIKYDTQPRSDALAEKLLSADTQESLSQSTQLVPVATRAGAYDTISDDVRFFVASSTDGGAPSLFTAFPHRESAHACAEAIRIFLGKK
ncbi:MAG: hypothetical protein IJ191_05480 [Treponema sp.]|nr:hypothetical protein [Treponema sp.]